MRICRPDYIFSISWEVCNKVGGIYTVLSTQAKTLQKESRSELIYVGPDFWKGQDNPLFIEDNSIFGSWVDDVRESEGIQVRTGRWNIPGNPIVFLVDFMPFFPMKNMIYAQAWELFHVDSLHAYGDYDEASMFSYAAAMTVKHFYRSFLNKKKKVIYHAHEWMTGLGALFIKHEIPEIATVFTTHATSIGRSICGNNKALYAYFNGYNGDQMAQELNMEAKHSIEKQTAQQVDCFTTVSDITGRECTQLLDITPHVITVNGFEDDFVPEDKKFDTARKAARKKILSVANRLFGTSWGDETQIIATGGRYEFRNKGIDLFLESIRRLRDNNAAADAHVLFLINVPAWMKEPRQDLQEKLKQRARTSGPLPEPRTTHWLHDMAGDNVLGTLASMGFCNEPNDNIKVLFVPCYLNGSDGIFNMSYYDLLIGQDLAVYPSYYEPWGYTPLESTAFSIPTITSDLAGFGLWANTVFGHYGLLEDGVKVIRRTDDNYFESADEIRQTIEQWIFMDDKARKKARKKAHNLAQKALWKHFIKYYLEAYDKALTRCRE